MGTPYRYGQFTRMPISSFDQNILCTADDVERVNEHLAPLQLPGLSMVVSVNNVLSYFENFESG